MPRPAKRVCIHSSRSSCRHDHEDELSWAGSHELDGNCACLACCGSIPKTPYHSVVGCSCTTVLRVAHTMARPHLGAHGIGMRATGSVTRYHLHGLPVQHLGAARQQGHSQLAREPCTAGSLCTEGPGTEGQAHEARQEAATVVNWSERSGKPPTRSVNVKRRGGSHPAIVAAAPRTHCTTAVPPIIWLPRFDPFHLRNKCGTFDLTHIPTWLLAPQAPN